MDALNYNRNYNGFERINPSTAGIGSSQPPATAPANRPVNTSGSIGSSGNVNTNISSVSKPATLQRPITSSISNSGNSTVKTAESENYVSGGGGYSTQSEQTEEPETTMNSKPVKKSSFGILAIIVIAVIGYYLYKKYN
ncbi:MAG: hypothetical protein WCT85_00705 [Parachlamydiales bacterium]